MTAPVASPLGTTGGGCINRLVVRGYSVGFSWARCPAWAVGFALGECGQRLGRRLAVGSLQMVQRSLCGCDLLDSLVVLATAQRTVSCNSSRTGRCRPWRSALWCSALVGRLAAVPSPGVT